MLNAQCIFKKGTSMDLEYGNELKARIVLVVPDFKQKFIDTNRTANPTSSHYKNKDL